MYKNTNFAVDNIDKRQAKGTFKAISYFLTLTLVFAKNKVYIMWTRNNNNLKCNNRL